MFTKWSIMLMFLKDDDPLILLWNRSLHDPSHFVAPSPSSPWDALRQGVLPSSWSILLRYEVCSPFEVRCPFHFSRDFASCFYLRKSVQDPRGDKTIFIAPVSTLNPFLFRGGKPIFCITLLNTWDLLYIYVSLSKHDSSFKVPSKLYFEPVFLAGSMRHFLSKVWYLNRVTLGWSWDSGLVARMGLRCKLKPELLGFFRSRVGIFFFWISSRALLSLQDDLLLVSYSSSGR